MSDRRTQLTRRTVLKTLAASTIGVPAIRRVHAAAPSETVYHASFGASGMAGADLGSLTASKNLKLIAVAEVDERRIGSIKDRFPGIKIYTDWRELLDKEKTLTSANISTPDHMHAPITMRAMLQGIHVYTQKPLTQTIYEA
ncbi:MAG: Gfo/Idh/MocA family oxidoreductase, partial [Isosphaeraceae bacterium]